PPPATSTTTNCRVPARSSTCWRAGTAPPWTWIRRGCDSTAATGRTPLDTTTMGGSRIMTVLDRFRLDGRVAVVTGASSGLGVAFARGFAEAGADVVLAARRADRLEETAQLVRDTGRRALCVATDVADPDQCRALAQAAMDGFGRVDVLVNNAGIGTAVPATRETPEEFRRVVDINLIGS